MLSGQIETANFTDKILFNREITNIQDSGQFIKYSQNFRDNSNYYQKYK